jgi:hypothetical protein
LLVGHIDAPFTAKFQKTHDKTRRMMRPRWPRDLDASARQPRGPAEEDIGRSATPGPRVERARLPLFVDPYIDSGTGPETAGRAHDRFATLFGQLVLATSTAAITAFVVFWTFTTAWTHGPSRRTADGDSGPTQAAVERGTQGTKEQPSSPRARLARVDDAIPLGVSLAGASANVSLLVSGLPAGSTISTGRPLEAGNWRLPASELSNAAIRPPRGFVGAIDLTVELRLADDTIADRQSLRLTWVRTPETAAGQTTGVAAPVGMDSTAPRVTPNSQVTSAPLRRLDREEIAYLLKRGAELLAAGELGPARLALRRAAEAGDPDGAFALATTYDPILLEARRVIGVAPDITMARAWYEKAKEFGSTDASRQLELLARAVKVE